MHQTDPERGAQFLSRAGTQGTPTAECTPASLASAGARPGRSTSHRSRFEALASLLGDDAPLVRDAVRRQFEASGRMGLPALRRVVRGAAAVPRGRARTLLLDRQKTLALRRLMRHVTAGPVQLEKALFLLARYHDPALDPRPWQAKLDAMAREVWVRSRAMADPLDRAHVLVSHLGRKLGYGGVAGDFHHPDNIHIQRVIDSKHGMPLALCALYMFVGHRAGIRATCLPLPGHVMLRLHGNGTNRIVDPYHHGQVRTEKDCRRYLEQNGLTLKGAWFRDANDATLLKRQVANLARSAELRGLPRERRELALLGRALESRIHVATPAGGPAAPSGGPKEG